MNTSESYSAFSKQAGEESATYERLARAIAGDPELLGMLDQLPEPKRQPNLLFGAVRYLSGPVEETSAFRDWVMRHWSDLTAIMNRRRTQTNEPGRCAALVPLLAQLPQPLALLEVGASAGLCLVPDAYRYRYGAHTVGPAQSPVEIDCVVEGEVPLPDRLPTVVWRAGLDLNPLDVRDEDDLRWLAALVWPEHHHRRSRLRAAADIVRADPPRIVRADLLSGLPALAAEAPADATLVIVNSAVLTYVPLDVRRAFMSLVRELPGHWISNEGPEVLPELAAKVSARPPSRAAFLLALDERPVAFCAPHGKSLTWLP